MVASNVSYLVTGATNDGREDSTRCVISCETGFAHSGSVVNDKSGGIFVTHLDVVVVDVKSTKTLGGLVFEVYSSIQFILF